MKYLKHVGAASALCLLAGCGVTSSNSTPPAASIQVDTATPAVTTGAKCAQASLQEFTPKGKKIGVGQIRPGVYTYVESTHLYIGENKTDGAVIEGHVSDRAVADKTSGTQVDCESMNGLKAEKNYNDNLMAQFASKMIINKTGDLSESGRRYLTIDENKGKFTAFGNDGTETKTVTNADLKIADEKNQTTPNKKREFWQTENGDLYMVLHSGVNVKGAKIGSSSVTRDSIIYYKRSEAPQT
jgi:hypothetical protein